MALIVADRVMETTTTTGTGALALGGAVSGYRDFDSVCSNNDTCYYCIEAIDVNGNPSGAWEVGLGTFTDTDTLTRTTVHFSSNANAAVDFAAGTKRVMLSATATYFASPAIQSITSAATVTPTFADDQVNITAQAAGLTLANPTGSAVEGWGIAIRIKDNGTARAISYGTQYRAIGVSLPSTTVISKTLYLGMVFNNADTKWDVVAVAQEA